MICTVCHSSFLCFCRRCRWRFCGTWGFRTERESRSTARITTTSGLSTVCISWQRADILVTMWAAAELFVQIQIQKASMYPYVHRVHTACNRVHVMGAGGYSCDHVSRRRTFYYDSDSKASIYSYVHRVHIACHWFEKMVPHWLYETMCNCQPSTTAVCTILVEEYYQV